MMIALRIIAVMAGTFFVIAFTTTDSLLIYAIGTLLLIIAMAPTIYTNLQQLRNDQ